MRRFTHILGSTTLIIAISATCFGGTIVGARTSRTGTIVGARAGNITGAKTGNIAGTAVTPNSYGTKEQARVLISQHLNDIIRLLFESSVF